MTIHSIDMILLIAAFICFVLASASVGSRINLTGLGLALWVLTAIV